MPEWIAAATEILPIRLVLTLGAIGWLFAIAKVSGTTAALCQRFLQALHGRRTLAPLALFAGTAAIAALGAGNVAAVAVVAPAAMALAPRLGLRPLLITLLIVGGANAGSLSPLSMTGLLAKELTKGLVLPPGDAELLPWRLCASVFVGVTVAHAAGFLALGGGRWLLASRGRIEPPGHPPFNGAMTRDQRRVTAALLAFAFLVVATSWPAVREALQRAGVGLASEPGSIALAIAAALAAVRAAPLRASLRALPWKAIGLMSAMLTAVDLIDQLGWIRQVGSLLAETGGGRLLVARVALVSAALSTFSSSSGVVMPLLIPMVPSLQGAGASASTVVVAIVLGAHLVDASPLSSLGALCIAATTELTPSERQKLFTALLVWGVAMIPCAFVIAAVAL